MSVVKLPDFPFVVFDAESSKKVREYGIACARAALEAAVAAIEKRRAHESSAVAYHAGGWNEAFEAHLTTHCGLARARDIVSALRVGSGGSGA